MERTVEVQLGAFSFEAEAFDVGQAEDTVEPLDVLVSKDPSVTVKQKLIASREIVYVAARASNPTMTPELFRAIKATPNEIFAAASVILKLSGFVRQEAASGGKVQVEAGPDASTST
jgi:hypothetical protein